MKMVDYNICIGNATGEKNSRSIIKFQQSDASAHFNH